MTTVGSIPSTGLFQSESEEQSAAGNISRRYVVETANEATFEAQFSIGTSTLSGLYLSTMTKAAAKGFSRYDLKYVTLEQLIQVENGGTGTSKSSDVSTYEEPIEQHPDYSAGQSDAAGHPVFITGTSYIGVTGYLKPATIYSRTEITNSATFSEANLVDGVGETGAPPGVSSATAGNWLKVGKSVSAVGDKFETVETWQYLPGGWNAGIYNQTY